MDWHPFSLDAKPLFDHYFQNTCFCASDFTFTNLYLWHFSRTIEWAEDSGFLYVRTTYPDQEPFIFIPLGEGNLGEAVERAITDFSEKSLSFSMRSITGHMVERLEEELPGRFDFIPMRDRYDYVYRVEDLMHLKGRKYHRKKNHLNQFRKNHTYSYERLNSNNRDELLKVWCGWFNIRVEEADISLYHEHVGIIESLKVWEKLDFTGGILRVDGEIVAFTLGEMLNKKTVVIHIEKADTGYHGAYQGINQQFLENEWSEVEFVNREEDLGIEGIRKAKLSYHPAYLIEKYQAVLI